VVPVNWGRVPAGLRERNQWIAWGLVWDGSRWVKVPLNVAAISTQGYGKAKSNRSDTWHPIDRVRAAWGRTYGCLRPQDPDGPGFVFARDGGLLGIDVDKCRNPETGELSRVAVNIMGELPGYWEVSPSGTGIKGFFRGQLPDGWKTHKAKVGDGPEEVETYDWGRFFCVTGQRVDGATADITAASNLAAFLASYLPSRPVPQRAVTAGHVVAARTVEAKDYRREDYPRSVRLARAAGWLRRRDPAVQDAGGDDFTFETCVIVARGFDLEFEDAFPLLTPWNARCLPPWNLYGTGANSLERKLHSAIAQGTLPVGCKLTERDTPAGDAPTSRIATPAELDEFYADLAGPPVEPWEDRDSPARPAGSAGPVCGAAGCKPGCGCVSDFFSVAPSGQEEKIRRDDALPSDASAYMVVRKGGDAATQLLHELVGHMPHVEPCPRRKTVYWQGKTPQTAETLLYGYVSCGCWNCYWCRIRLRWGLKDENVPFALSHGTHRWRGTPLELNAVCKRLDRAQVKYSCCWIAMGDGERGAVFAVASESIARVPTDIPNMEAATGEQCARRLAHLIDTIPANLPAGAHRRGTRGPLEWAPELEESDTDCVTEAGGEGGSGDGEGGGDYEEVGDIADAGEVDESHFEDATQGRIPLAKIEDLHDLLCEIDCVQQSRGIPERERVNARWGLCCNSHKGGAIEQTLAFRRPDDPDLMARIEALIFGPQVAMPKGSTWARESRPAEQWQPSDDPIPW
jgi:hypothetical protein